MRDGVSVLGRRLALDPGRSATLAALLLFALGFLPLPFGSLATLLFLVAGLVALVEVLARGVPFRFAGGVRFAVIAAFAYYAVDAAAVILYGNRGSAWMPAAESVHFLFFPFLLAVVASVRDADPLKVFVWGARAGAIAGAAIALVQVFDNVNRVVGGMINPIPFGSTATLFAFIGLIGFSGEGRFGRVMAVVAFAAGLAASLLSQSRAAWMAVPVLAIVTIVYVGARYGRRTAVLAGLGLAVLAAVVGFFARDALEERLGETLAMFRGFEFGQQRDHNAPEYSLDQRVLMVVYGMDAFGQRPLLGYGPQNAVAEVQELAAADGYTIGGFGHLHNELLTEAVGNGLLGLATLFLVLAAPVVVALRAPRDGRFGARIAIAAMLTGSWVVFGLTGQTFRHDISNTVYLAVLLALAADAMRSARLVPVSPPSGGAPPAA
ncbi:MAG: O-antigen ligase family protein [Bauldia sp.]|nr:O-antigen ligase family protein [Bauldia sp.]